MSLLTTRKAASFLGMSESTVKRMCDNGKLAFVRTAGGHRRIPQHEIQNWIDSESNRPSAIAPVFSKLEPSSYEVLSILEGENYASLVPAIKKLLNANHSLAEIFDRFLIPAMWLVGDQWECGTRDVYQEHICSKRMLEVLHQISPKLSGQDSDSQRPIAVGCAIGTDQHGIASRMVEGVLNSQGWNATCLGGTVPVDSLLKAIRDFSPSLVWVSSTFVRSETELVDAFQMIHSVLPDSARLIVGGQSITADIRRRIVFDFAGDTMRHLSHYTSSLLGNLAIAG